ncbi:arsenate reductase (glutaredoxin) [Pukyongia salina]|uniref:Arsenate reductase (Glutaredoxin) n=1 Tax=Pukyongia salina TaxID=2094025 RepID=A0A2S0HZP2_9FLAO|nr:arsenate reductase (glutaredoxin) [Pukyongia salina]AVI52129.1 arsenate reductase (glutaredoxin) [Pukyongia salina]
MTKIYHNPRCSKSRQTVQLLEREGETFETVLYMDSPPTATELTDILKQLGLQPIDLVRMNEQIWKENYKGKDLTNAQIVAAMVAHPRLIERPIVIKNGKAALGRPPENILGIL